MTRSARQKEDDRMTNDAVDPRMRPAWSALVTKLRTLHTLDDPYAAALIIDDMMYQKLSKHPNALWYIMQQAHSYWVKSIGGSHGLGSDESRQLVFGDFQISSEDEIGKSKLTIDWEDKALKKRVRLLIWEHGFTSPTSCECGREFEFAEEWANHVRSVIWKELQSEQPGESRPRTVDPEARSDGEAT